MSGEIPPLEEAGRTGMMGTLSVKATPDDLRLAVSTVGVALVLLGLMGIVGFALGLLYSQLDLSDEWDAFVIRNMALSSVSSVVSLVFGVWAFKLARGTGLRGDLARSVAVLISFVGIYLIARGVFSSVGALSWAIAPSGSVTWPLIAEYVITALPWLVVGFMLVQISRHRLSYRPKWMKKELAGYQVP